MFKRLFLLIIILAPILTVAQNLDELFLKHRPISNNREQLVFGSTRILNGHSTEQVGAKHFSFRYSQRFDPIKDGINDLFGFDRSFNHLALDYGITDWLMLGFGRSNIDKTANAYIKLNLLSQTTRVGNVPFYVSYVAGTEMITVKWWAKYPVEDENILSRRFTYFHQLLVSRKFNRNFSLQLTPTYIMRNYYPTDPDNKNMFALGVGSRYKISDRVAIQGEYYYAFRNSNAVGQDHHNSLSLGVEIEAGGNHVQLLLTNARSAQEVGHIWGERNNDWLNGGIHFGFNFSRVFSFSKQ